MPTPNRPLPYGMDYRELEPDPSCIDRDHHLLAVVRELHELIAPSQIMPSTNEDMERMFDAGFALAMRMILDPEYAQLSRGQILAIALDTAIVWERG